MLLNHLNVLVSEFTLLPTLFSSLEGDHGYSNGELDMQPFFIAHGPAFKKNFQIDQFEIVDIYPLLCHLLDLTPPPNDGSLERVEAMIDEHDNSFTTLVTCKF